MAEQQDSERKLLDAHLDGCRAATRRKFEGLTDDLARQRLGKTPTSMAGILKHLTQVEKRLFQKTFLGLDIDVAMGGKNRAPEFEIEPHETVEFLLAEHEKVCQKSRQICAQHELNAVSKNRFRGDGERVPLRWIYLRLIDETAHHNGHLDIYRELLDGTVGL